MKKRLKRQANKRKAEAVGGKDGSTADVDGGQRSKMSKLMNE